MRLTPLTGLRYDRQAKDWHVPTDPKTLTFKNPGIAANAYASLYTTGQRMRVLEAVITSSNAGGVYLHEENGGIYLPIAYVELAAGQPTRIDLHDGYTFHYQGAALYLQNDTGGIATFKGTVIYEEI